MKVEKWGHIDEVDKVVSHWVTRIQVNQIQSDSHIFNDSDWSGDVWCVGHRWSVNFHVWN